ncbi:MAG: hypothetical protein DRO00_01040, partial [Thermoproteota archaeon]
MRKKFAILISLFLILTPFIINAQTDQVIESNTESTSFYSTYGSYWRAQTFEHGSDFVITRVRLNVSMVGSVTTDLIVEIRDTNADGTPGSTVITSGSIPHSSITSSFSLIYADLTNTTLNANTKYAIVMYTSGGDSSNYYKIARSGSDVYPNGTVYLSGNSGDTWNEYAYDFWFEVWGYYPSTNEPPTVSIYSVSPTSVYRGNSIHIKINATDPEGNLSAVKVNITNPSGSLVVTNGLADYNSSDGLYHYFYSPPASAELGAYDVTALAIDNESQTATDTLLDAFTVLDNPPSILSVEVPSSLSINETAHIKLAGKDFEDSNSSLTAIYNLTAPNGTLISQNIGMAYNSTDMLFHNTTIQLDTNGTWTLDFLLQDTDGGTDTAQATIEVFAGPSIQSLTSNPTNGTRPTTFELTATISNPSGPLSDLQVTYIVFAPDGTTFDSGNMTLIGDYFKANISVQAGDQVGFYDVNITAVDPNNQKDSKLFNGVFKVYNLDPLIYSIEIDPPSPERGDTVYFKINSTDPDGTSVVVKVKLIDPDGDEINLGQATLSSGLYTISWVPASNQELGEYNTIVTSTDVDGNSTVDNKTFILSNAKPVVVSITAEKTEIYVNASTLIYIRATDYEDQEGTLTVWVYALLDTLEKSKGIAEFSGNYYVWAFVPTEKGTYSFRVEAFDSQNAKGTKTAIGLVTAINPTSAGELPKLPTDTEKLKKGLIETLKSLWGRFIDFIFGNFGVSVLAGIVTNLIWLLFMVVGGI